MLRKGISSFVQSGLKYRYLATPLAYNFGVSVKELTIGIPKEPEHERRVAISPDAAQKLIK